MDQTGRDEREARLDALLDSAFDRSSKHGSRLSSGGGASGSGAPGDWDDFADRIVSRARDAPPKAEALDAFEAPSLDPEPGESGSRVPSQRSLSRNGSMSDEIPKPPASRRPSLKELAESVKNRPAGGPPSSRGSVPPASLKDTLVALDGKLPTPPPPSAVPSSRPSTGAPSSTPPVSSPRASVPSAPPTSAPVSAPPSSTAPASAPPSSAVPASAPASAAAPKAAVVPIAKAEAKKGSGMGMGVTIAAIGIAAAAAFAFWSKSKTPEAPPQPTAQVEAAAEPKADEPKQDEAPAAKADEKPAEGVIDINQLADASDAKTATPGPLGGPLPPGSAAAPPSTAVANADPAKPAAPGGPGEELGDAIRNRAGGGTGSAEEAEPAAEQSKKNLPDVPPTGAVTSAVNAVKGNAKGCVAGADEPSSATITFGPSGAVQSVSVGGWASGKGGPTSCIKSALQGARVPPFAKSSYSTSVTIRP